jgi:hypothetical protein
VATCDSLVATGRAGADLPGTRRRRLARNIDDQDSGPQCLLSLAPSPPPTFERRLMDLKDRYRDTPAYHAASRRLHVRPFYEFLAEAGRVSEVLVVKGNHDDDFPGDYRPGRRAIAPFT